MFENVFHAFMFKADIPHEFRLSFGTSGNEALGMPGKHAVHCSICAENFGVHLSD